MAGTHNFQIFDESMTSIDSDADYLAESQRLNGVTPGLASPEMHNKLYRQCSVMAYAIASVVAARGYNMDDSDPAAMVNSLQRAFAFSVNGDIPNGSGAISTGKPLDAWPVGSIFMTTSSANPATILGGGTWQQIQGQFILASKSGWTAGNSYGSMTKTIQTANLPAHTHSFTTGSAGDHTHTVSGTAASAGVHNHGASTASAGAHTHSVSGSAASNGAHTHTASSASTGAHTHSVSGSAASAGTHNHTASTASAGAHTHSVGGASTTTGAAGSHNHWTMNDIHTASFDRQTSGANVPYTDIYYGDDGRWEGEWREAKTSVVADHTHVINLTSGSAGAHTHTVTVDNGGAHTHTTSGTAASNGDHSHTITVNGVGGHTHTTSGTAASNGAHIHSVTVNNDGAHTHTTSGTAASAGAHAHTGTTDATGGGTALDVMPLGYAVNVWRRTA